LALLPKNLHLANDPWFILTKENVKQVFHFLSHKKELVKTICSGGLANESLFAIIFKHYGELDDPPIRTHINCASSHIIDWYRMSSPTSPHVFKEGNEKDIEFIDAALKKQYYAAFIRKVAPEFPDTILRKYIYDNDDKNIRLVKPYDMIRQDCIIFVIKNRWSLGIMLLALIIKLII